MKKITIIIIGILAICCTMWYGFYQYRSKKSDIETNNIEFTSLYEKEVNGSNLATLINKAFDKNETNNVKKDSNGQYIDNNKNSIKIEIKFKQSDKTFPMESINENQVSEFIRLYGQATFKCTEIEYHKTTKYVKYLYFEEI